ncbi:hypothetical protein [Amycolatopsis cihanbeyliensis]|uniref:hypothetical protein n=1 Tax=Amycolatopsis cihanbeyliensis TaxID=1128664 RepID=UPI001FE4808E|nr:hypothetical protein [Amycolatopsis cihanbeyliensis]
MGPYLPPGVVSEVFVYASGRREQVYRAPLPSEGPEGFVDGAGRRGLVCMYGYFVFEWVEGARTVCVSHGRLRGARMLLWRDVSIDVEWSAAGLTAFAQRWVREHLAKFMLPGEGVDDARA